MKKGFILSLLAISALSAGSVKYVDLGYAGMKEDGTAKILKLQPLSELVGDSFNRTTFSIGSEFVSESNKDKWIDGSRIGVYFGTEGNDVSGGDYFGGINFTLNLGKLKAGVISPYIGGFAGLGIRGDKGETVNISTKVNSVNYVTTKDLNTLKKPTKATFTKDSAWTEAGAEIGLKIKVSHLNIKAGYRWSQRNWDIEYRTSDNYKVLNPVNKTQKFKGFVVTIGATF
jgi:hypothetical protein